MRIVPLFLAAALGTASGLHADAVVRLSACGLTMELPGGFVLAHAGGDSLRAATTGFPRWNLIAYCTSNSFKTDRKEAVLAAYKQAGDYLRTRTDVNLADGYKAVVLRRTPAAEPVQRIEAFFSSRDNVYHIVVVPDQRNAGPDEWKSMQQSLETSLKSVQIEGQEPAISEEAYTLRLVIFAGSILALLCGVLWLLLRRVFRRKQK